MKKLNLISFIVISLFLWSCAKTRKRAPSSIGPQFVFANIKPFHFKTILGFRVNDSCHNVTANLGKGKEQVKKKVIELDYGNGAIIFTCNIKKFTIQEISVHDVSAWQEFSNVYDESFSLLEEKVRYDQVVGKLGEPLFESPDFSTYSQEIDPLTLLNISFEKGRASFYWIEKIHQKKKKKNFFNWF